MVDYVISERADTSFPKSVDTSFLNVLIHKLGNTFYL